MASNQSGKTWAGGFEHAMHLTGRYPDWWQGRTYNKPPLGWVASETSEITRDGVQRILMGRLQNGEQAIGTGAIPRDAIKDWKRKQHGAADSIEYAVVRWGGGGDVQAGEAYCGFKSYDQGRRRFQADTLDFIWFDEEPDEDIYFEGVTRTNTTLGLVTLTFTPLKGMSNVVMRYLEEEGPERCVTHMTIADAGHYSAEQRAKIIASYPAHEREARAYGRPTMGSGRVYPVLEESLAVEPFEIPAHWFHICALDFGWDHPQAAVELVWDKDQNDFYVTRARRQREATPVIFVGGMRHWGLWQPWAWPQDGYQHDKGSGEQLAQAYADQGLKMLAEHAQFVDGSRSLEAGVQEILTLMQTGHFFVFANLEEWFKEFRMYHRKDGKIVDLHDDILAATRYAYMMRRYAMQSPRNQRDKKQRTVNFRTV
jgi:phage terminase large subunit-like protein